MLFSCFNKELLQFFLNFDQTCSVFIPIYALFDFFCYVGLVVRIYDNLLSYYIIKYRISCSQLWYQLPGQALEYEIWTSVCTENTLLVSQSVQTFTVLCTGLHDLKIDLYEGMRCIVLWSELQRLCRVCTLDILWLQLRY